METELTGSHHQHQQQQTSSSSTTSDDEWIFTIRRPHPETNVVLRQSQPNRFHHSSTHSTTATTSSDQHYEKNDLEQESLLQQESSNSGGNQGWTWSSPYWSLQSSILLSLTYYPAWQALPIYTKKEASCCSTYTCYESPIPRDYRTQIWTAHDIKHVEPLDSPLVLPGVGPCQAVKVHLKPLHLDDFVKSVPETYQAAWRDHVKQAQHNQTERKRHESNPQENQFDASPSSSAPEHAHPGPTLLFAVSMHAPSDPALLWKVEWPRVLTPLAVESVTVFQGPLHTTTTTATTTSFHNYSPTHIYINGYQSWSFAGSLEKGAVQPTSALPRAFSGAFLQGGRPPPTDTTLLVSSSEDTEWLEHSIPWYYQSDFFTCITSDATLDDPFQSLDETGGPSCTMGWLSQHEQLGVLQADRQLQHLILHASAQGQVVGWNEHTSFFETDWAYAQLTTPHSYDEEPMVQYLHCCAAYNQARSLDQLLTGWCSWYVFYENISQDVLQQNFGQLSQLRQHILPTNVAVVDDGYMTAWGDWDSCKKPQFPHSMGVVAKDIQDNQMQPGLWMAPFAADKHSQLVKDHPDWVLRNDTGAIANSANIGRFFCGLDATNPAVREHVRTTIQRAVKQWHYTVLKIDFLYAACLEGSGKYDMTMSRAQAMRLALQTIREAAGDDVFLIGCGCPIAAGIGMVDAMRVSPDTGPGWYPQFPMPWWDDGTLPALKAMIRNSVNRAPLGHRWWHNDPDCLMLGNHTKLTNEEVASAASIVAMTCGMLLLSDDLPNVDPERMRIVSKIFPLTGIPAVVLDLHATNNGMPSLMRLWATDRYRMLDTFLSSISVPDDHNDFDHNAEAAYFAKHAAFDKKAEKRAALNERKRSCIHVTHGLGTWSIVSISNWKDKSALVEIPPAALLPVGGSLEDADSNLANEVGIHGYHTLAFWSGRYSWMPDHRKDPNHTISPLLKPHETEIYHIKPVTPESPQYIGSDLHFSCGKEVRSFRIDPDENKLYIRLVTTYHRTGSVFVFLPRIDLDQMQISVTGQKLQRRCSTVGNVPKASNNGSHHLLAGQVVQIPIEIFSDKRENDGEIEIMY